MSEQAKENLVFSEASEIKQEKKRDLSLKERANLAKSYEEKFTLSPEEADSLVSYLFYLGLRIEDLIGKKVLDIGSGGGDFKKAIQKIIEVKDGEFVNFDIQIFEGSEDVDVLGAAETLSFKKESFDFVLANFSVPVMWATQGEFELALQTLKEMVRVLRKGGSVRVYPVGGNLPTGSNFEDQLYFRLLPLVVEKLKSIVAENPSYNVKMTKIFSDGGFETFLEIDKK